MARGVGCNRWVVYLNSITQDGASDLTAIDAGEGSELWRLPLGAQGAMGWAQGPFAGSGVVVLEVDDAAGAAIVGIDAPTGTERWRLPLSGAELGPLANTDEVAVLAGAGGRRGVDRQSGSEVWTNTAEIPRDDSGVFVSRGPGP